MSNRWASEQEAIDYIFRSINGINWRDRGLDEHTRDIHPTRRLLQMEGLLQTRREYAIVTGSKGKGSVTVITANILKHLGHRVGTVTSPHLVTYRERMRVNGQAIPLEDFLRILESLTSSIDAIQAELHPNQYLSPQGIFLAMALRWFDEQAVNIAMIEIGRGGRFDDNSLVPNMLSLFTPILHEHTRYLGDTLERIAWHKAGIIKPQSYAYSLPQAPEVLDVIRKEAEALNAQFEWIMPSDMGYWIADTEHGVRMALQRYGEIDLPFLGHYEIDNATLAVWGAGNIHGRLSGVPHASTDYVQGVRRGLETAIWYGRCQQLQERPKVFIDGAINPLSLQVYLKSIAPRLTHPVIGIAAVPTDRDAVGVYGKLASVCDALILTRSERNIAINFPNEGSALSTAQVVLNQAGRNIDLKYAPTVAQAIELARAKAGPDGSVVMAVAQPAIGDALEFYNLIYEQI
ncbi:MAG: Mur ligase family protein [Anaerolineae bacterium]|jgi:dihydrofolate synthase/folylpolyglutamate synthase|nr:Mur ligase family protein [Anaerolineae bacterium]